MTQLYNVKQGTVYVPPSQVISADGAITAKMGIVVITKGTAAAITIAAPISGTDDFKRLTIVSATAAAHTITNTTPGFNNPASSTSSDVATASAAKGNTLDLIAYQGAWYVVGNINFTLA